MRNLLLTLLTVLFALIVLQLSAQVSINIDSSQPDPSAMLDVKSTSKGLLLPRMTQNQIALIAAPSNGLIVYCTTDDKFYAYVASANSWKEILFGPGVISPISIPILTTTKVTNITSSTASSGGNVISDGGSTITTRGVCWSLTTNPTIADYHTTDGSGSGVFISNLTGLTAFSTYYVRAYAINDLGIAYGNETNFATGQHFIGENFGGGVVFYIDDNKQAGQHGLIASHENQFYGGWGCPGILLGGTTSFIGSGLSNTNNIVNSCQSGNYAALVCYNTVLNGFYDWYLPSKDELTQMFLHKDVIYALTGWYWSSTEDSDVGAWWMYMDGSGVSSTGYKHGLANVRAIRSF